VPSFATAAPSSPRGRQRATAAALIAILTAAMGLVGLVSSVPAHAAAPSYGASDLGPIDQSYNWQHEGNSTAPIAVTSGGAVLFPFAGVLRSGSYLRPSNDGGGTGNGAFQMFAINDNLVVVGQIVEPGTTNAAIWTAASGTAYKLLDMSMVQAALPSGSTVTSSAASSIDDSGRIVGTVGYTTVSGAKFAANFTTASATATPVLATDPRGGGATANVYQLNSPWEEFRAGTDLNATLYNLTTHVSIPDDSYLALATNGAQIAGVGDRVVHPDGSTTLLTVPPGDAIVATSISNDGTTAGEVYSQQGVFLYAAVWDSTGAITNLAATTGLPLVDAVIGSNSTVVAWSHASDPEMYLLTPGALPAPVVNSIGDAVAINNGSSGCDTGATVTIKGASKPECTLRAAIQAENAGSVTDKTITFALPGTGEAAITIQPATALPALTASGVTIDGTSQAGGFVSINGFNLTVSTPALHISGGHDVVQGFQTANAAVSVLIDSATGSDTVRGNSFGTTVGGTGASGDGTGVDIENSPNNVVGGTGTGDRNVLSFLTLGVLVHGPGSSGTRIQGNSFGTIADGTQAAGDYEGIGIIDASNTVVGGATTVPGTGAGNLFVGSSSTSILGAVAGGDAITVGGFAVNATGNSIQGNTIGLLANGVTSPASDFVGGISVIGRALNTVIGGSSAGTGNVIALHAGAEIALDGTFVIGTQVLGNLIGTDRTGHAAIAGDTSTSGVLVAGAVNSLVGTAGIGANVITAQQVGIFTKISPIPNASPRFGNTPYPGTAVTTSGVVSTVISGNIIGPFAGGMTGPDTDVQGYGVILGGTGDTLGPNNEISFNGTGVMILTPGETVVGNDVGVDSTGLAALPNGNGVLVQGAAGATGFTLGVPGGKPNTISGNLDNVLINSSATVQNNYVGTTNLGNAAVVPYLGSVPTTVTEAAFFNSAPGIIVGSTSTGSVIGGTQPGMGNVISGNGRFGGLALFTTALVQGNKIGVGVDGTTPVPNSGDGVVITGHGTGSVIGSDPTSGAPQSGPWPTAPLGGNIIANNGKAGIAIDTGITGSVELSNSIYGNTDGGILHVAGAIAGPSFVGAPTQDGAGSTVMLVSVPNTTPGTVVQIYAADSCTDGGAQGRTLLQTDTINSPGLVMAVIPIQAVGTRITATLSSNAAIIGTGRTSDFSACTTVTAKSASITPTIVAPGGTATVTGTGFQPSEKVDATLHSEPLSLGSYLADPFGTVTVTFTVPAGFDLGAHEVVLVGETSGHSAIAGFTVAANGSTATNSLASSPSGMVGTATSTHAGALATTGQPVDPDTIFGAAFAMLLGTVLLRAARRRPGANRPQ
jgi:hypothetical protein